MASNYPKRALLFTGRVLFLTFFTPGISDGNCQAIDDTNSIAMVMAMAMAIAINDDDDDCYVMGFKAFADSWMSIWGWVGSC